MGILWLILKILLWIILIILVLILSIITLILILPVDYLTGVEKYDKVAIHIRTKIFYIVTFKYQWIDGNDRLVIKVLGRTINKKDTSKRQEKSNDENTPFQTALKPQKLVEKTTHSPSTTSKAQEKVEYKKIIQEPPKTVTEKETITKQTEERSKVKEKVSKQVQEENTCAQESNIKQVWEDIKQLWQDENRKDFLRAIKRLIKNFYRAIVPEYLRFNIVIGTESVAQTGELLAIASMFYPFYYKYGVIQGEFEEEGLWGEVHAKGRIRLYQILKPIVIFILNKSVRNYIKMILKLRKEENKWDLN